MKGQLHFDGGARPKNPGYGAFGFVLEIGKQRIEFSRYLGIVTNNQAEYTGLIVGLKTALEKGVEDIVIFTDSKLIEGHLQQGWTVGGSLFDRHKMAHELLHQFQDWDIHWVPRSNNSEADALCTAAINWGRNKNPWVLKMKGQLYAPAFVKDPFSR